MKKTPARHRATRRRLPLRLDSRVIRVGAVALVVMAVVSSITLAIRMTQPPAPQTLSAAQGGSGARWLINGRQVLNDPFQTFTRDGEWGLPQLHSEWRQLEAPVTLEYADFPADLQQLTIEQRAIRFFQERAADHGKVNQLTGLYRALPPPADAPLGGTAWGERQAELSSFADPFAYFERRDGQLSIVLTGSGETNQPRFDAARALGKPIGTGNDAYVAAGVLYALADNVSSVHPPSGDPEDWLDKRVWWARGFKAGCAPDERSAQCLLVASRDEGLLVLVSNLDFVEVDEPAPGPVPDTLARRRLTSTAYVLRFGTEPGRLLAVDYAAGDYASGGIDLGTLEAYGP
ncbi:hypothetical protein JNJ66_05980 [Candidatus Saccharibacteria bacterium]|nr:hypothetical protein [Candidatus Saccharibacteria bacterium]